MSTTKTVEFYDNLRIEIAEAIAIGKIKTAARLANGDTDMITHAIHTAARQSIPSDDVSQYLPEATKSPTLPNGDQDDRDDFPRELWTPAELDAERAEQARAQAQEEADLFAHLQWEDEQEQAQAHADASAALATNDRDGWDGAATRAEQLASTVENAFCGLYTDERKKLYNLFMSIADNLHGVPTNYLMKIGEETENLMLVQEFEAIATEIMTMEPEEDPDDFWD